MSRARTWIAVTVAAIAAVSLVGCGGGGGVARLNGNTTGAVRAEADHSLETINTAQAVAAPKPQAPLEASAAGLAELGKLETAQPLTDAELRQRLDNFTRLATASPKDVAAQTGLALSLAAIGVVNGARVLGAQLPADLYVPVAPSALAAKGVKAGEASTKAMELALQPAQMMRGGGGKKASAQGVRVKPQALVPGQTFTTQEIQAVLADLVLPSVKQAIDRLDYIVANSTDGTVLLDYTSGSDNYHAYRQDMRAIATGLRVVYAMGLLANAYNWDWGTYQWDLDWAQRDANHDGLLMRAEWAPPSPFMTLLTGGAANLSTALAMLQTAVTDARAVLGAIPSDTASPLNKATEGQLPEDLQHYRDELQSASTMLAGQVTASVEYAFFNESTQQFYGHTTMTFSFNLGRFLSSPISDLKGLLPPRAYLVPDNCWNQPYQITINPGAIHGSAGLTVNDDRAEVSFYVGGYLSMENDHVTVADLLARTIQFTEGTTTLTVHFNEYCTRIWGTYNDGSTSQTFDTTSVTGDVSPQMVMRADEMPDRTMGGLFPSPTTLWNNVFLAKPAPVIEIFRYGNLTLDQSDDYYRSLPKPW